MKILVITDFATYGGVAKTSEALQKCLLNDGNVVERYPIYERSGILSKRVLSLKRAINYLRVARFDRIILMHFEAIFVGVLCSFFQPKGTFINAIYTDLYGYYCGVSVFKKALLRLIFLVIKNDQIVFDSKESELKAVEKFGFTNTRTIYNIMVPPVEPRIPSCRGKSGYHFCFGSVSRLHSGKNIDLLIRVFNSFWLDQKETRLLIFGDGPELARLKDYALGYPCSQAVTFEGYLENPEEIYSKFDALVGFSNMEGFGLVILEALARKIPVLFSDCSCGPREILKPTSNPRHKTDRYEVCDGGFLVKLPSNIEAYAPCLQESERGLLEVMKLFYDNFDEMKRNDFVDLERFGADVISREWSDLLRT
ncbi:glycosyltransferase [Polaromonas sp. CG_9.11]|uniref:glycosyltransferase n=1 Tax=Polaromonas sp. CG_9.11 TaxID=2787730 RepID=UPI0018CB2922|nr:glycosyltransferase [Polaromonas sp. CG_9.11]MBG6074697.1 glycosyltransferase involved in cell wall biosynthesis [Polaromonas sp. CG_9.11]